MRAVAVNDYGYACRRRRSEVPRRHRGTNANVQISHTSHSDTPQQASDMTGTIAIFRPSLVGQSPPVALTERGDEKHWLKRYQHLSQVAYSLNEKIDEEVANAERLQQRLEDGHRALGTLVKDSIRLQTAITTRRQQNERDKQELDQAKTRAMMRKADLRKVLAELREVTD